VRPAAGVPPGLVARPRRGDTPVMSVRTEQHGDILVVTIDRPERRNAVDAETAAALASAFRSFDVDPSLSVAVLTGAGGHFCGGADLKALAAGEPRPFRPEGDGPMGPTRLRLGKPVIAAIEGYAVAGGLELALWCDLRVASEEAILGVFCRRFGAPLVDLGTVRLPQIIGLGRAMDLVLTGRPVKAQEAWTMGLVNRTVPEGQALRAALDLARELAALPQTCLRNDRLSLLESLDLDAQQAMENEVRHGQRTLASGETLAGAARFHGGAGRHGR
jgi:enoyl-CoA hydratase/carnithine racemase